MWVRRGYHGTRDQNGVGYTGGIRSGSCSILRFLGVQAIERVSERACLASEVCQGPEIEIHSCAFFLLLKVYVGQVFELCFFLRVSHVWRLDKWEGLCGWGGREWGWCLWWYCFVCCVALAC